MKKFDLAKLEKSSKVDTSIGTVHIFSLTVGNQSKLTKELKAPIEKVLPTEYLLKLIPYICYTEESLQEEKYKPDSPVLEQKDIEKLSTQELELIADSFIKNNPYLYKARLNKTKINDHGDKVYYSEQGEIEHPQDDDESNTSYLHRLMCINEKNRIELFKKITSNIPNLSNFTSGLSTEIVQNLATGNRLSENLTNLRSFQAPKPSIIESVDWAEIERNKEKRRREPFDELAAKLDSLLDVSVQTSQFIIKTNEIQTDIAGEIKSGSNSADRHSKINLYLTYIVIFLTVVGLGYSIWSGLSGVSFSSEEQKSLDNYATAIKDALNNNNKIAKENNATLNDALLKIGVSVDKIHKDSASKDAQLEQAIHEIQKLKEENRKNSILINSLNNEIQKLKSEQKA